MKKPGAKAGFSSSISNQRIDARELTGWLSLEMVTSTRRFCARPAWLALLATG